MLALLFTDLVGSTRLKNDLGDFGAVTLIQNHHALVREILRGFPDGEEIETAGDSFFIVFVRPSDAVRFALLFQSRLRLFAQDHGQPILDRIGIHVGEVVVDKREDAAKPKDLYGIQVDTCARVTSLAAGNQILLSRTAFDNSRPVLKGEDIDGVGPLSWVNYGPYLLKGVEEPLEICEVGETDKAVLRPPPDSEKVHRFVSPDSEPVLGWRPAIGQAVPQSEWVLEEKLGEGDFGEVWVARNKKLNERRVFKFCFRADRVRSLKREVTIFRLLKERAGEHPNIVKVHDVYFDEPPFYIVMDYVEGKDLALWCEEQGGLDKIPYPVRLEIVIQVARALQAAHDAGVIHRDVKPSNILVCGKAGSGEIQVKLTDFGVGQIVAREVLAGLTRMGFTQTMMEAGSQTGTQMYMAPELIAGEQVSTRSDTYSLGVVLYQMLVGNFRKPVTGDWQKRIADPLLREELGRCLTGDPQDRLSRVGELADALSGLERRRTQVVPRQGYFYRLWSGLRRVASK